MGGGLAGFICFIINSLLGLLLLAIIINAILSWLVAFDVINRRNRLVGQLLYTLDMVVAPILAPLRAVIPNLGGLDITPIIAWLIITGRQTYLLRRLGRRLKSTCRTIGRRMFCHRSSWCSSTRPPGPCRVVAHCRCRNHSASLLMSMT